MSHGTVSAYQRGCRCDECREGSNEAQRRHRENRRRNQMVEWPDAWWTDAAACTGETELFFAPAGERPEARVVREAEALSRCESCPVIQDCGEYALRIREEFGIWGGLTELDRRRILRRRGAA